MHTIKEQRRRRSANLSKRRKSLAAEEWQELETYRIRLKEIIEAHPQHQHALWGAYATLRDFVEVA